MLLQHLFSSSITEKIGQETDSSDFETALPNVC